MALARPAASCCGPVPSTSALNLRKSRPWAALPTYWERTDKAETICLASTSPASRVGSRNTQRGSAMTRRATARRIDDREAAGAINFDAALDAYCADRGDPEELLAAATLVVGSTIALGPERADAIADLTGTDYELADYDDAGRAIRRWFAQCFEPGARH